MFSPPFLAQPLPRLAAAAWPPPPRPRSAVWRPAARCSARGAPGKARGFMGIISFSWEIGDFGEIMENQLSMGLFHGGSYGLPWGENHGNMVKKSWEKKPQNEWVNQ